MNEIYFGNLNKRSLHLRFSAPWPMEDYKPERGFTFAWRKLFSPRAWWRSIFSKHNYMWHVKRYVGMTHRCWCCDGVSFDGNIHVAGFVFQWFYSHYTGEIPCVCDKVLAELQEEITEASDA